MEQVLPVIGIFLIFVIAYLVLEEVVKDVFKNKK